jgi:gliding motility-associated peptidyl-prolyl isomerase
MKYLSFIFCFVLFATSCKSPEARKPISRTSGSFMKESAKRNKLLYEQEKKQIEQVIAKDSVNKYIASANGFWYFYNNKVEQDTIKPQFGDILSFNYTIKNLNGTIIYSKEELKTQRYVMDKQELFSGLREGLKLMKPNERITFIFPSLKAYGYYGDTKKIGRSIPLICDVTLHSILKTNN